MCAQSLKGRGADQRPVRVQGGLSFVFVAIAVRILGTANYGLFR